MLNGKRNNSACYSIKKSLLLYFALILFILFYRTFTVFVTNNVSYADEKNSFNYCIKDYASEATNTTTAGPRISSSPTPYPSLAKQDNLIEEAVQKNDYCLSVPVLIYHHIQPQPVAQELGQTALSVDNGIFDQQMAYLSSNGYITLFAEDLINALRNKTGLPPKSVLITIDDGYKDIYTYAYPILKKYNIKANLMIPTGLMENTGFLLWSDIKEMQGSGLVNMYNHTWSHSSLGVQSREKIESEIIMANIQLQDNLGKNVTVFTYPYGSQSNLAVSILINNGFTGAFSTNPGFLQCNSFRMGLHRNRVGNSPLSAYGL